MKKDESMVLDSIFFSVPALKILSGVYLELHQSTITALIGRNGSGKSTLLKIAAGQIKANSGITMIKGERIHSKSIKERFHWVGYLPQESMLPGDIKVSRVLDRFSSVESMISESKIGSLSNQKVKQLSGGERRLLEISILFSLDRAFFLLDEPFSGVEPKLVDLIIARIRDERDKGKGILLTDHMHRYVTEVADNGYLLHNRQCYELGHNISKKLKGMGYLR